MSVVRVTVQPYNTPVWEENYFPKTVVSAVNVHVENILGYNQNTLYFAMFVAITNLT